MDHLGDVRNDISGKILGDDKRVVKMLRVHGQALHTVLQEAEIKARVFDIIPLSIFYR